MKTKFGRRDFLKVAALATSGAVAAGVGIPLVLGEQPMLFESNDSYWARAKLNSNPALDRDIRADIAIIGAGYTGLSAAWHLLQHNPHLNVVVLEAQYVGHGASGRNGGMVLPQTGQETLQIAEDQDTHALTYNLTVQSMRAMQKLVRETNTDCELKLDGYCYAIFDANDLDDEAEYVHRVNKLGMPLELWDATRTRAALGTDRYRGAIFDPNGGRVHAMKLANALKIAAEQAGAHIYENSPVTNIKEGKDIELRVGDHTVTAPAIVLATNAYTSKLGYFKNQVMPVHAQCAATPPLSPQQLAAIGWQSQLPFFDSRNFLYHMVLTADNRIVVGGGSAEYFFRNDLRYRGDLNAIGAMMLSELVHLYPSLNGIHFESVWDGVLGMSFDETESVGVTGANKNIYYGLAYNGHGVNTAFLFGDVIASLYHGIEHDWQHTAYANHELSWIPPEPFKWLGVTGLMQYYQWQDRK